MLKYFHNSSKMQLKNFERREIISLELHHHYLQELGVQIEGPKSNAILRWDQAETVLLEVIKRSPSQRDARYLLGRVYEHNNDWQRAAQEYRAMRDAVAK
jgi:hypothetical protein